VAKAAVTIDERRVMKNETAQVSGLTGMLSATHLCRFVLHHAAIGRLAAFR